MPDLHSKEMGIPHSLLRHAPTPQVAMGILGKYIFIIRIILNSIKIYLFTPLSSEFYQHHIYIGWTHAWYS